MAQHLPRNAWSIETAFWWKSCKGAMPAAISRKRCGAIHSTIPRAQMNCHSWHGDALWPGGALKYCFYLRLHFIVVLCRDRSRLGGCSGKSREPGVPDPVAACLRPPRDQAGALKMKGRICEEMARYVGLGAVQEKIRLEAESLDKADFAARTAREEAEERTKSE